MVTNVARTFIFWLSFYELYEVLKVVKSSISGSPLTLGSGSEPIVVSFEVWTCNVVVGRKQKATL
uniref:Ovule protein n=1 Tax=Loa loa TaxID=7209 RepID=A0A1I7VPI0_LOALO